MKLLLQKELKSGDLSGLHAECLSDAWIGKDRLNLSVCLTDIQLHIFTLMLEDIYKYIYYI